MRHDSPCHGCRHTRSQINGLYCKAIGRYVEHATERPCEQAGDKR